MSYNNRSWMYRRSNPDGRFSWAFENGVEEFLEFAFSHVDFVHNFTIRCPCKKCVNLKSGTRDNVKEHLYYNGFMPQYYVWVSHGEIGQQPRIEPHGYKEHVEGNFIDGKSAVVATKYKEIVEAKFGADRDAHPEFDTEAYMEATGEPSRGRYYGIGSSSSACHLLGHDASSSCRASIDDNVHEVTQSGDHLHLNSDQISELEARLIRCMDERDAQQESRIAERESRIEQHIQRRIEEATTSVRQHLERQIASVAAGASIEPEFFRDAMLNAIQTEMVKVRHDIEVDFERREARRDAKAAKAQEYRDKKMLEDMARLLEESRRRPPPTPSSSDEE